MVKIMVSTVLEKDVWERWKASHLKLNHVVMLGLMSAEQTPGYIARIRELEQGNEKLQGHIQRIYAKMQAVNINLDELSETVKNTDSKPDKAEDD